MPFTFSHPAIILPVTYIPHYQKYISLTALTIGSIIPDFEYFLRMKMKSTCSHTLEGLLYFDVPVGFLFCYIFHHVIKKDLITHLPWFLKNQLQDALDLNWHRYCMSYVINFLIVIFSLLLGAFSHLFWDSFTHETGYFVQQIPFLRIHIIGYFFGQSSIPMFKVLQHSSTLIGGLFIFWFMSKCKTNQINQTIESNNKNYKFYWCYVLLINLLVFIIQLFNGLNYLAYGDLIVNLIAGFLIATTITPCFLLFFNYLKNNRKNKL